MYVGEYCLGVARGVGGVFLYALEPKKIYEKF